MHYPRFFFKSWSRTVPNGWPVSKSARFACHGDPFDRLCDHGFAVSVFCMADPFGRLHDHSAARPRAIQIDVQIWLERSQSLGYPEMKFDLC